MPDKLKSPFLSYDADGNLQSEQDIFTAIDQYRRISAQARQVRHTKNKTNWDFFHGRQDFSHKLKHQSQDFMPDFPLAVERISIMFAAPFADAEDWLDIVPIGIGEPVIDPIVLRRWLLYYMNRLYLPGNYTDLAHNFALVMSDASKMMVLEAVACVKVYAVTCYKTQYMLESGNPLGKYEADYSQLDAVVKQVEVPTIRLAIDSIPWEDYFPDPSGHGLFDIHEKSVTLTSLRDNPDYDVGVIESLVGSSGSNFDTGVGSTPEQEKRRRSDQSDTGDSSTYSPRIQEVWGDVVDLRDGKRLLPANTLCTVAPNRKFLRPPIPNPFWHGRRPFVKSAILRVPLSETHKAIADHAVPVARAMNELDNLMLDGALATVWGTRQVRPELLENEHEIEDGIPQGYTAKLKDGVPTGEKFLERVDTGEVPQLALEMQRQKNGQFQIATALPDVAQGVMPPRAVKACVPMNSEALTREGWRRPQDLTVGQEILAFNPETKRNEWTPILELYFPGNAETYEYRNNGFKAVCTDNHRWVQRYHQSASRPAPAWQLVSFDEGWKRGEVLQAASSVEGPGLGKLSHLGLLNRTYLSLDVLKMTSAERQTFIVGVLAGEGTVNRNKDRLKRKSRGGSISMSQNPGPVLDAFRLACTLEGIATNEYNPHLNAPDRKYVRCHRVSVLQCPYRTSETLKKSFAGVQEVWCPRTAFKTWVMRQGMTITITGNTEVAAAGAASQGLFGGFSSFTEKGFVLPVVELAWMTLWQYCDDFLDKEVVQIIGPERALTLQNMSPAERFVMMSEAAVRFNIKGLRQVMQSADMFGRLTTFLQSLGVNPALMMAFDSKYDLVPYLEDMLRGVRLQPERYEKQPGGYSIPPETAGLPSPETAAANEVAAENEAKGAPGPTPAGGISRMSGGTGPGGPTPGTPSQPGTTGTGGMGSKIEEFMAETNPRGWRGSQP